MKKHEAIAAPTPGPWKKKGFRHIVVADERIIDPIIICEDIPSAMMSGECQANASLVSAAPDLLSALEDAVALYGREGGPWNIPSNPGGWLSNARLAIAKARRI